MIAARDLAPRARHRIRGRGLPFTCCVEEPDGTETPAVHSMFVKGWLVPPRHAEVGELAVEHGGRTALAIVDRPDIREQRPRQRVVGFEGLVSLAAVEPGSPWHLVLTIDGHEYRRELPARVAPDAWAGFTRDKAAKLDRIEPLLRCPQPRVDDPARPSCLGLLAPQDPGLVCTTCGAQYGRTASAFDFLSDELRAIGGVEATSHVSHWGYDPIATSIIDEFPDGFLLDAGSGLKVRTPANVINLEIAAYPTTDVLAIGERLPFASESLDGVLSLAVLEHVRDPFRCAAEIARVVRPGGRIYVSVPFLQPYHGYPHHYYNMTRAGLEQLFTDAFEIDEAGVPASGLPVFTLTWFLKSYLNGLPPETARRFASMHVRDLLGEGDDFLGDAFVGDLSPAVTEELASTNYLVATKR